MNKIETEGWSMIRLADYGKTYSGLSGKSKDDFGRGKPYISYLNIFENPVIGDDDFSYVEITENEKQSKVKKRDLFFTTSSESPEEVGMASVYEGNIEELYLNSFCFGYRVYDDSKISTNYLAQYFRSNFGRKTIFKLAQGATRYNLSKAALLKEYLHVPPYKEQIKITQLLQSWDESVIKIQTLITKKELRQKWLMIKLLSGEKRIDGFNSKWKEYTINELFEKSDRYVEWNEEQLYNLVSIRRRYGGLFFRGDLLGKEINVKKLKSINSGDFLISKRQVSHGAWAVVTYEFQDGKVSDEYVCLKISDNNKLISEFWAWYCKQRIMTHYAYLDSIGVHIEKLIFHYHLFKRRKIVIPKSTSEQVAIVKVLQTAEQEIELLRIKMEKLKEQKKGLMQQLLTGKTRITNHYKFE